MARTIITEKLYDITKDLILKYPTLDSKAIALILIGSGECESVSDSTVRRIRNANSYQDYVTHLREAKDRWTAKNCKSEDSDTEDKEFKNGTDMETLAEEQRKTNERLNEINETLKTIAILISALLNEWRGNVCSVSDNIKGGQYEQSVS